MSSDPEKLTGDLVRDCGDCGQCREMMADAPCRLFPTLFALYDRKRAANDPTSSGDLAALIDSCHACGQCPCDSVLVRIRQAKDAFVARDGLPATTRLIENVPLLGQWCGAVPGIVNAVLRHRPAARLAQRLVGVHPDRQLPTFPPHRFDAWAKERGLDVMRSGAGRKVAYFVGCTARYFFPEVARATIAVLEHNGVQVHIPQQHCCGMPTLLEGDRNLTFRVMRRNLEILGRCIAAGYDIVTSCPTCSFMFKTMLAMGVQFSESYRRRIRELAAQQGGDLEPLRRQLHQEACAATGRTNAASDRLREGWLLMQLVHAPRLDASDDGYFAELDAARRIDIASHTYDLGEYLRELGREGALDLNSGGNAPPGRLAYFAPCHQREQRIGRPWPELLKRAGIAIEPVGDLEDCCGLGGVKGFKADFHATSLALGERLMRKMQAAAPDRIVTDCLACRLQFGQMLGVDAAHPAEVLRDYYFGGTAATSAA